GADPSRPFALCVIAVLCAGNLYNAPPHTHGPASGPLELMGHDMGHESCGLPAGPGLQSSRATPRHPPRSSKPAGHSEPRQQQPTTHERETAGDHISGCDRRLGRWPGPELTFVLDVPAGTPPRSDDQVEHSR